MGYIRNKVFYTDTDMLHGGFSPYAVVLSENPSDVEIYAAEELIRLFKESTGVELPKMKDKETQYNFVAYYFSIGKTTLYRELEKDHAFLNEEAYPHGDNVRLFTKGNLFFFAGNGAGPILSVYEFCEKVLGYKYFHETEWTIGSFTELKVPVLDVEYHPNFPRRALGFYDTERDYNYVRRLKLCNTLYSGWIENAHTYFKLLPKSKYFETNPEWYSPDGNNLCLSNESMKEEFSRAVIERIKESSDKLFMLGQEDTFEFCSCPKCRKKIAEYGGRSSGLAMEFTNSVAREVAAYFKNDPDKKDVKLVSFAYNSTYMPPAFYDKCKGKYVPLTKEVIAEKNVAVMVVPYNALYSASFVDSEMNAHIKEALYGWQAISEDIMIWSYCTIYQNYMIPFNNWRTVKENYDILKNIGVTFFYDAASYDTPVASFEELRQYVHAALMWGTEKSTSEIIHEFCEAYYGEAAPCMEYVIEMQIARAYYNEGVYKKYTGYSFDSFNELMDRKLWTKEYVMQMEEVFSTAKQLVKLSARKELLLDRIEKEYSTIMFLKLKLYPEICDNFDELEKEFVSIRKKHSLYRLVERDDSFEKQILKDEK